MKESILKDKSFAFAVRIVGLSQYIQANKKDSVLSKQILRSGTAIALKEANETNYWIKLLYATNYIEKNVYESLSADI
jgi:hypothetical protein